ncbi:MAG: hypothetical protein OXI26_10195 [bacterium]|nr:hypothetical protein [bacterium]
MMVDPNDRTRAAENDDDDVAVDWDDFEAMGKRVLELPPQPDTD